MFYVRVGSSATLTSNKNNNGTTGCHDLQNRVDDTTTEVKRAFAVSIRREKTQRFSSSFVSSLKNKRTDYFERLVKGEEWRRERRDPAVAAKFVCNNLFGLLKEDLDKQIGVAAEEITLEG